MPQVFVYGTLCRGQCREECWPREPLSVAVGYVRGRLFDLGPYPAMLPGDDWVRGEYWTLREEDMPETLRVLDAIEGYAQSGEADLYRRQEVDIFPTAAGNEPPIARGVAYFLVPERLPKWAHRIEPCSSPDVSAKPDAPAEPGPAVDPLSDLRCAYWPSDDRSAEDTCSLSDPFEPTE